MARHGILTPVSQHQDVVLKNVDVFHVSIKLLQVHVGVLMDIKSRCRVLLANRDNVKNVCTGMKFFPANFVFDHGYVKCGAVKPVFRVSP